MDNELVTLNFDNRWLFFFKQNLSSKSYVYASVFILSFCVLSYNIKIYFNRLWLYYYVQSSCECYARTYEIFFSIDELFIMTGKSLTKWPDDRFECVEHELRTFFFCPNTCSSRQSIRCLESKFYIFGYGICVIDQIKLLFISDIS